MFVEISGENAFFFFLVFFFRDAQYVLEAAKKIKEKAHWEVDVDVEAFHVRSGANQMAGGLFMGRTLLYSDLNHVVLRILPKFESEAAQNAILVSSHIDTVFSTYVQSLCIFILLQII